MYSGRRPCWDFFARPRSAPPARTGSDTAWTPHFRPLPGWSPSAWPTPTPLLEACTRAGIQIAVAHQLREILPIRQALHDHRAGKFRRLVAMGPGPRTTTAAAARPTITRLRLSPRRTRNAPDKKSCCWTAGRIGHPSGRVGQSVLREEVLGSSTRAWAEDPAIRSAALRAETRRCAWRCRPKGNGGIGPGSRWAVARASGCPPSPGSQLLNATMDALGRHVRGLVGEPDPLPFILDLPQVF